MKFLLFVFHYLALRGLWIRYDSRIFVETKSTIFGRLENIWIDYNLFATWVESHIRTLYVFVGAIKTVITVNDSESLSEIYK